MKRIILAVALTMALNGQAWAVDEDKKFVILGAGTHSCEKWVKGRRVDRAENWQRLNWVLGFVTGYNAYVLGNNAMDRGWAGFSAHFLKGVGFMPRHKKEARKW